ncbi:MAG: hypothetical protein CMM25_01325 [Rhodospirillaceae bacterium]|nr:hypothetical protein [Rhodospirillaceae bacterium]
MEKDEDKQPHNGDEYGLLLNTIEPMIAKVIKKYNSSIMIPLYVLVIILFLNIIQTFIVFRLLWNKTLN